jgi:hypothetical protein
VADAVHAISEARIGEKVRTIEALETEGARVRSETDLPM